MPDREADIRGPQRKIITAWARPARSAWGDAGIRTRDGLTVPFEVGREWSAPAGHYAETWYLVHPETREVYFEGPVRGARVVGLQSMTAFADEVSEPLALAPGTYQIVFALDGLQGGQIEVEVSELTAEEAA